MLGIMADQGKRTNQSAPAVTDWRNYAPGLRRGVKGVAGIYFAVVAGLFVLALFSGDSWMFRRALHATPWLVVAGIVVTVAAHWVVRHGRMSYMILRKDWWATAQPMTASQARQRLESLPSPDAMPSWHGAPGIGYAHLGMPLDDMGSGGWHGDFMEYRRTLARLLASIPQVASGAVHVFWRCGGYDCVLAWDDRVVCIKVYDGPKHGLTGKYKSMGRILARGRQWMLGDCYEQRCRFVKGPAAGVVTGNLWSSRPLGAVALRLKSFQWRRRGVDGRQGVPSSRIDSMTELAESERMRMVIDDDPTYETAPVKMERYAVVLPDADGGAGVLTYGNGDKTPALWGAIELLGYLFPASAGAAPSAPIRPPHPATVALLDRLVYDLIDLKEDREVDVARRDVLARKGAVSSADAVVKAAQQDVAAARAEKRRNVSRVYRKKNAQYEQRTKWITNEMRANGVPFYSSARMMSQTRHESETTDAARNWEVSVARAQGDLAIHSAQTGVSAAKANRRDAKSKLTQAENRLNRAEERHERLMERYQGQHVGAMGADRHLTFLNWEDRPRASWEDVNRRVFGNR